MHQCGDDMYKKILRLLFDYSKNYKLVDINYIDKLIEIVVNEEELGDYIKSSRIVTSLESDGLLDGYGSQYTVATYTPFTRKISVYENSVNEMLEKLSQSNYGFSDIENLFYQNLCVTQTLLHEVEHANQAKIKHEDNSLEAEILRLSDLSIEPRDISKNINTDYVDYAIYLSKLREQNYKENYKYAPFERLAEVKSYGELVDILSQIKDYIPNLVEYEKYKMYRSMICGFDVFSPTIYYIEENAKDVSGNCYFDWYDSSNKELSLEKCKKKYSKYDRLKYGLMIDNDEYNACNYFISNSRYYS